MKLKGLEDYKNFNFKIDNSLSSINFQDNHLNMRSFNGAESPTQLGNSCI